MPQAPISITWLKSAGLQVGQVVTVPLTTAETMAASGLAVLTTPPAQVAFFDPVFSRHGRKDT